MTGTCCAKRGLLTLRDCGELGVHSCIVCRRDLCLEHAITDDAALPVQIFRCLDCYAKFHDNDSASSEVDGTTEFDADDRRSVASKKSSEDEDSGSEKFTDS